MANVVLICYVCPNESTYPKRSTVRRDAASDGWTFDGLWYCPDHS